MLEFNHRIEIETLNTQFIASFLAAWVASHYDMACARGEHDRLSNPPVEDAQFLADEAWQKLRELKQ